MDTGRRGIIRGDVVMICRSQLQVERRCTIAHELVHDERRLYPTSATLREKEEAAVERIAARRLIQLPELVDALRACSSRFTAAVADHLWVDVPMLQARMDSLDPLEVAELERQLEDQWLWIP